MLALFIWLKHPTTIRASQNKWSCNINTTCKTLTTDFALVRSSATVVVIDIQMWCITTRTGSFIRSFTTVTMLDRFQLLTATVLFRFRVIPGLKIVSSLCIACSGERFKILSEEDVRGRGMYVEVLAEHIESTKG